MFRRFVLRLLNVLRPRHAEDELARETAAHLALLEDDFQQRGFSPETARVEARRAFGGVEQMEDRHRDARSFAWIDDLRADLRYGLRGLRRSPGFTLVVVATLAIGIGANTAMFSVVHAVLLRPLPYKDPARLVRIWENVPGAEFGNGRGPDRRIAAMTAADLSVVLPRTRTLAYLVGHNPLYPTTTIEGDTTRMYGYAVWPEFFAMMGVPPLIGRTFAADEGTAGRNHVIVLGYEAWQRLGGDVSALGRQMTFSGDPTNPMLRGLTLNADYTVIGVMPRGFRFPYETAQFWVPRAFDASVSARSRIATFARLADGVTPEQAAAELDTIRRESRGAASTTVGPNHAQARFELVPLQDELTKPVRPALIVLTAAVGVVLLIACVNAANLLLARTASRQHEMAVRAAIGAGRGRLIRQLLTDSVLLAGLGGVAGVALAGAGIHLFVALTTTLDRIDLGATSLLPRIDEIAVDGTVLGYALLLSFVTSVIFGIVPALRHARPTQAEFLREATTSRRTGVRDGLVVAEVALATLLLVGGGLLIHSFVRLATVDPGFNPSQVLTFQVTRPMSYRPAATQAFAEALVERLHATPGVEFAAYARQLPLVQLQDSITLSRRRNDVYELIGEGDIRFVSRDYLATMGIRVVAGRGFTDEDGPGRPAVVLINDAMARRDFPNESPIGQTVFFGRKHETALTIVGIVANVRQQGLDRTPQAQYFLDYRQLTIGESNDPPLFPAGAYYSVRTTAEPGVVVGRIRAVAHQLDAQATVDNVATMEQIVSNSITRQRMYAVLVAILSGIAMILSVIGLYGVMAYTVAQRTREIGIRMALGARPGAVVSLVLRQGAWLSAIGLTLGLAAAAAVTRFLEGLLFGLTPLDPATFAAVAILFSGTALIASYIPARRAANVDPLIALRFE